MSRIPRRLNLELSIGSQFVDAGFGDRVMFDWDEAMHHWDEAMHHGMFNPR